MNFSNSVRLLVVVWSVCLSAIADDTANDMPPAKAVLSPMVSNNVNNQPSVFLSEEMAPTEKQQAVHAELPGEQLAENTTSTAEIDLLDKERVWTEISDAISGLNDMVGDKMFRDLRRTSESTMEVRVDMNYWERVRYQTRVDLKNDISNIWHLYARQYGEVEESSVYFIDDLSNKTIDIFTQGQ